MTEHIGNYLTCLCSDCKILRKEEAEAALVQRASTVTLSELYKKGKARGLLKRQSAYN